MKIIRKEPNPNGAYPAPQSWNSDAPPNGCAIVPDTVDMTTFYEYNGFVVLTFEGDTVTAYTPNVEAWEAWKASLPEPEPEPQPTMEERVATLEEQLAQADETNIALFEAQAAQEEINTAQDEALIALFEMIGGEE